MPDYFTLLRERVTLRCRSIDRIFLQAYVPKLQTVGQVCTFLRWQRRFPIPSSAAFGKIGDAYVEALPAPDVVTFHQVTRPSNSEDGLCVGLVLSFLETHHRNVVILRERQPPETDAPTLNASPRK